MNPDLERLQAYPFERLNQLKAGLKPVDKAPVFLSIGEPKHPTPAFIAQALIEAMDGLAAYPATRGTDALRECMATWLIQRYQLKSLNPATEVLPVNGTREALFAFAQAMIDSTAKRPQVLMPNPFYQIYEGAALLAGAEPVFLNLEAEKGFIPDFDAVSSEQWQDCQLLYVCTPGNPTGAVIPEKVLQTLINKAEQYDFIIASDECYSEIYQDEANPPVGLLQAASNMGNDDFKHCVVFNSLSKRSNVPGLRAGLVAGDAKLIKAFLHYRTYHGCAMALPTQVAAAAAWGDEAHVKDNRDQYRQKYQLAKDILNPVLPVDIPPASFYLWLKTPIDEQAFAAQLFEQENITVLPGSYLSRDTATGNPGKNRVRIALVAPVDACRDALNRLAALDYQA